MKLQFLNRESERKRLEYCFESGESSLAVVYGRRRCGKSTLLQNLLTERTIYYLADQTNFNLQMNAIAVEIEKLIPGFASVIYPDWSILIRSLNAQATSHIHLVIDEFPYLVQESQSLPSVIQKYMDTPGDKNISFILCGSSQRMMHGMIMDSQAPLYGRAREILKLSPLNPGWIMDGLGKSGVEAIEYYSVFGGIPRYWELAADYSDLEESVRELILDRKSVLHDEPMRLLLDDLKSAVQPYSILSLLGQGCRKVTEIASRLEIPVSSLSRPLSLLIELGYVKKENPFGENPKKSKRSLYSINDNFINFHFRFVVPNKSALELDLIDKVWRGISPQLNLHYSNVWEDLARWSVPFLEIGGIEWEPASRWWGKGEDGSDIEMDILADSSDGKSVLVAEVKWSENIKIQEVVNKLKYKASLIPFLHKKQLIFAVWIKYEKVCDIPVITPQDVLNVLR